MFEEQGERRDELVGPLQTGQETRGALTAIGCLEGGNYTSNYNYNYKYSRFYAKFYIVVGLDLGSKNVQECTHQKR